MPGVIAFDSVEARESRIALASARHGQEETLVLADDEPRDVRPDEPDEADGADEGDRYRREQRDEGEDFEAQPVDADAERLRPPLAEAQGRHRPGAGEHRRGSAIAARRRRSRSRSAEARPRPPIIQNTICCSCVSFERYWISARSALLVNRSAIPTRIIVSAETPRSFVSAKRTSEAAEREGEGIGGDEERPGAGNEGPAEGDGEGGADARRGRDAEGERIGERVAEDRLHAGAGKAQHGADEHRHRRDRQAQVEDHDLPARIGGAIVQGGEHVAERRRPGPDRKIEGERRDEERGARGD